MSIEELRQRGIDLLNTRQAVLSPRQWPECARPADCRASTSMFGSGIANNYRASTVDREGNVHQPSIEKPKVTRNWHCETCGKRWSETVELGA